MKKVNRITVVSPNYPSKYEVERGAFVEALVSEWEEAGKEVNVIAPSPIYSRTRKHRRSELNANHRFAGEQVLYPKYLSMTSRKCGPFDLEKFSHHLFERAALRAQRNLSVPDIFYGKFLTPGGTSALKLSSVYARMVFADLGESKSLTKNADDGELARLKQALKQFTGVVCVSPRLVNEVRMLGVDESNILLAPNQADSRKFYPRDKVACRRRLGLPEKAFLVVFLGHFIERKGPLRVQQAIDRLGGNVKGIFLGRGPQMPSGENVIKAQPVSHDELPEWLCAADVMVLPTLAEGCCNAINEALSCQLPIISSDIDDVRWQVGSDSILVDPLNIGQISEAICRIMIEGKNYEKIGKEPTEGNLKPRGERILEWIEKKV